MILEFVTFKTPADWDRARILEDAKHTIPKWVANRDLLRKHFALGIGADEGTSVGIYIWPSVEAAKKAQTPQKAAKTPAAEEQSKQKRTMIQEEMSHVLKTRKLNV